MGRKLSLHVREREIMSQALRELLQPPKDWDKFNCSFYLPNPDDDPILTAHWKFRDGRRVVQRYKMTLELSEAKEIPAQEKIEDVSPVSAW